MNTAKVATKRESTKRTATKARKHEKEATKIENAKRRNHAQDRISARRRHRSLDHANHRDLHHGSSGVGPGLLESIYSRAICLELETVGLLFEVEKQVPVLYKGIVLCYHRLDIVVDGNVLLEIKAVERLAPIHYAQVLSYLRISKLPVALLMNFNSVVLPDGLKRIVL